MNLGVNRPLSDGTAEGQCQETERWRTPTLPQLPAEKDEGTAEPEFLAIVCLHKPSGFTTMLNIRPAWAWPTLQPSGRPPDSEKSVTSEDKPEGRLQAQFNARAEQNHRPESLIDA